MHSNADASSPFGDEGAVLEGVVDAFDTVPFHCEQEAGGHLRTRSSGVEEGRTCVGEPLLRHQVVGFDGFLDIFLVDSNRNTHKHLLWAFCDLASKLH